MAELGFIGIGAMGEPMAGHLLAAGHALRIHDIVPERAAALAAKGARACANGREVSEGAEVVFLMVLDAPDVEAALFGPGGVTESVGRGTVVVDMSTIPPARARENAARLGGLGVAMVDAPVSGGTGGAEAGTLTIMAGGDEAAYERVRPLLELMGRHVSRVGGPGHGQAAKGANQIMVSLTIEALAEALRYAAAAGADPDIVRRALAGGLAQSNVLDLHGPALAAQPEAAPLRNKTLRKDMRNVLATAAELGADIPIMALAGDLYARSPG